MAAIFVVTTEPPDKITAYIVIDIIVSPGFQGFRCILGSGKVHLTFLGSVIKVGLKILASIVGDRHYIVPNGPYSIRINQVY